MGRINSKQKGARFERELASKIREEGYESRRTAQYCGNTGDASDVLGLDGIHIEAKHAEKIEIYKWMEQAIRDSKANGRGDIPAVFFKKNYADILVCVKFEDFMKLFREWDSSNKLGE
jgi:Holliday junction resolvase